MPPHSAPTQAGASPAVDDRAERRRERTWPSDSRRSGLANLEIDAEYVGDAATLDVLRELGVDHAQGYHLGRPQVRGCSTKSYLASSHGRSSSTPAGVAPASRRSNGTTSCSFVPNTTSVSRYRAPRSNR
jgi:hypothetical protein